MSKRFDIHDWQAKQANPLLNEGVWEIGSKQAIQEFISKMKQLKNIYWGVVGSDTVMDGMDSAIKGAEELMKHAKNNPNEMEENTTGTGASFNAGSGEGYMTPNAFKKKNK